MDIVEKIGVPALLGQTAEECAELAQAVLKMQRILEGKNPTPVTEEQARKNIAEEGSDVLQCLNLLAEAGYIIFDGSIYVEKKARWERRLEG